VFGKKTFGFIKTFFALALLLPAFALASGGAVHASGHAVGAVYTLTNEATGNRVTVFDRYANGTLAAAGSYSTGGLGSGNGLGSQGAVVLGKANKWLFAVNAGSNEISVFSVDHIGLTLVDKVSSGGTRPISLTTYHDLLYVLNAGGNGNITGFSVGSNGHLTAIAGSTRPLSSNATGPAQVQFSADGRLLAVTEKTTNMIDIYMVNRDGTATGPTSHPSSGTTPFGFAFGREGKLVVSEAATGAVSSYTVDRDGSFNVVSASSPTHQTAACWLVLTDNERYTYTANAGSDSISGYSVGHDGSLSLLNADGRTASTGDGSHPTDTALNSNSHYLYVLTTSNHGISAFAVQADGSLTPVQGASGLAPTAVGLAAR
jgi:6-phosphogluconolactonase